MITDRLEDSQINGNLASASGALDTQIIATTVIPLLAERLVATSERRKTGEVVIRKEIATKLIQMQVPVRYERLLVERVDPEYQLLAAIDLDNNDLANCNTNAVAKHSIVYGQVDSLQAASELLRELATISPSECTAIKIEIEIDNVARRDDYQQLIDLYSNRNQAA